jgi:DNA invertase Pin-like site-specific DNA recombinase
MIKQVKRAALYVRVSTDHQRVENQIRELSHFAERRGWEVVEIYRDGTLASAAPRAETNGRASMPC